MSKGIRRWFFVLLHLTGFVLLWLVVRDMEWNRFFRVLKAFPLWKYFTGLGILCTVYAIKSLRWYLLNRAFAISTSWITALIFYLSAGFLSVITPGRLGEFAKIYFLKRKYGIELTSATSSVILDRIWDVLVLSVAAGLSLIFLLSGPGNNPLSLLLTGLLFAASLIIVLVPSLFFKPLLFLLSMFPLLHSRADDLYMLWKKSRFSNFLTSLSISAGAFLMLSFIPVLFSSGTCCPVGYEGGIGAISISNILSFLPVTIAGFGTRELVFAGVWDLNHYPREMAISVSTAYFMVTYLGSLLIGGVVYLFHIRQLYRPREIARMEKDSR